MNPTVEQFRAAAMNHVGYVEGPRNNETIFGAWYGMNMVPWCAEFQSYVWIHDCGGTLPMGPHGSAAVASFRTSYQQAKKWGSTPKVGAFVCYGHDAHIEWVDEVHADGIWTIGGNTGQGSYNNGGGVYRQFRYFSHPPEAIEGYCYPDYAPGGFLMALTDAQQKELYDKVNVMFSRFQADDPMWGQTHDAIARVESSLGTDAGVKLDKIVKKTGA